MKFWEAMKLLQEGHIIRRKEWASSYGILLTLLTERIIDTYEKPFPIHFISDDWELYQETEKTYTFTEVVQGLKEGNRYSRKGWIVPGTVFIKESSIRIQFSSTHNSENYALTIIDLEAKDWIEVKEHC